MKESTPSVGDIIEIGIEDIAYGGEGVGRHRGLAVFVPFVAPGETVRTEITERKPNHARGRLLEVLAPSADRIPSPCPHFTTCGGCRYQHLPYSRQLEIKHRQLVETLRRIGGLADAPVRPVIPSPLTWGYRNRILVRTGWHKQAGRMHVGFLEHDSRRVVDVESCPIADPRINRQLEEIRRQPAEKGGIKYNLRLMPEDWELPEDSFFQINESILPRMVEVMGERLADSGAGRLIDVYCGVGFFCLQLAHLVERFLGIEIDRKAIRAARANAGKRGLRHGEFIASPGEVALPRIIARFAPEHSAVILDPPRKGCDARLVECLLRHPPRQILYVSCHPATLCRDLKVLCSSGRFVLDSVTPLDMFPHTGHLESISDLRRVDGSRH